MLKQRVHKSHHHPYVPTEPHILRNQSDINKWALQVEETFNISVYGVKGTFLLSRHIPTKNVALDYMHAGVIKAILECSIDTQN